MAQFLTPDVKQGNPQGMDPYNYVGGNPTTRTDPTGQRFTCGDDCGGGGKSGGGSGGLPPGGGNGCDAFGHNKYGEDCGPSKISIGCHGGCKNKTGGGTSPRSSNPCGKLSAVQCNKGQQSQQQDIQDLKNHQQWLKVGIAGLTFATDLSILIKDLMKASGILKVLEVIGDFLSLVGDGLTILSQISTIFHWTGVQAAIDLLSTIANTIGAVYKGIRAALATPWGAVAAGLLVLGFYTLRTTIFGGPALSLVVGPILGALADHVLDGKDNPWKFGFAAAGSALQAWYNQDQYQIDVLSNESVSEYCQSTPAKC